MKILSENQSQGEIKVLPEHLEDLWCLQTILTKGDLITGTAIRKITLGDKSSENTKTIKKPITVTISAEKILFSESYLKIQGIIQSGPDDIPKGSHQSINVEPQTAILIKKNWLGYQEEKLKEAVNSPKTEILACIFDREQAIFARLINNSFVPFLTLQGNVEKKGDVQNKTEDFFETISQQILELNNKYSPNTILCGSSHFWKENLNKKIDSAISKKIVFTTIGDVNQSAFSELLSRTEVKSALSNVRASQDAEIVEELFAAIGKEKNIAYGITDVSEAALLGAIERVLCSEKLIKKTREEDTFDQIERIFSETDKNRGKVIFLSGESDATKKLDGLGGIAAFLRFPII